MVDKPIRGFVIVTDEEGKEKRFLVEALFDMGDQSYALLKSKGDILIMRVEDNELIGIASTEERDSILEAYQIAVESLPNAEKSELRG